MLVAQMMKVDSAASGFNLKAFPIVWGGETSNKKSCNFLIFCLILTNFLPKCRAQNVDSEKGHGAGKKGMTLEKKGMARRHSKSG